MKPEAPIFNDDDPAGPADNGEAWRMLSQPTGRRKLSWFVLIRVVAMLSLVAILYLTVTVMWRGIRG